MPYTTREDVRLVLSRDPADTEGNAASLDDANLDKQITEAESRIDVKLGSMYKVPFAEPVPKVIANIARDIAAFLADLTFREIRDYESDLNPVYLRYREAMKLLEELASGKAAIPGVDPDDGSTSTGMDVVAVYGGEQLFDGNEFGPDPYDPPILWGRYE